VNEPPGFIVASLEPEHRGRIAEILRSTENFREEEVDVALELFDESFGDDDYVFVGAYEWERGTGNGEPTLRAASSEQHPFPVPGSPFPSDLVGFACYGPAMDTDRTYDLYWIAVDRAAHGSGCGSVLLSEVERRLEALHARMLVIETSSRSDYTATR
jgi:ribosomal protein S18 acetylase RimI-like enzyme